MRAIMIFIAIAVASCANMRAGQSASALDTYAESSKMQAQSGQISWAERSANMRQLFFAQTPYHPIANSLFTEYWQYHAIMWSDVDARRTPQAQAEYLITQKWNQTMATLQNMAAMESASRPPPVYVAPQRPRIQTPRVTNCHNDGFGNTFCTTQ